MHAKCLLPSPSSEVPTTLAALIGLHLGGEGPPKGCTPVSYGIAAILRRGSARVGEGRRGSPYTPVGIFDGNAVRLDCRIYSGFIAFRNRTYNPMYARSFE